MSIIECNRVRLRDYRTRLRLVDYDYAIIWKIWLRLQLRSNCNRLQSIMITIVIDPNPGDSQRTIVSMCVNIGYHWNQLTIVSICVNIGYKWQPTYHCFYLCEHWLQVRANLPLSLFVWTLVTSDNKLTIVSMCVSIG